MQKNKVFFDMDGTLNVWERGESFENVCAPGYMRDRIPLGSIVQLSNLLQDAGVSVWIASSVLPYAHSVSDKDYWIEKHCPWIPKAHRIYIPYGENKSKELAKYVQPGDIIIDDYTKNLEDLQSINGLICIKCVNGVNDTKHTWKGERISAFADPQLLCCFVLSLLKSESYPNIFE